MHDIFLHKPILENDTVLLRAIEPGDWKHLLPFSLNEPDIWKFGLVTAAGEENLRNYVNAAVKNLEDKKEYTFIVFDKRRNKFAGSTRFYDINPVFSSTQLGYTWYGGEFQRTGLNRYCKFLLFSYVFEEWGLERCELRADKNNFKSVNAMKSIGCVEEGILRSHMPLVNGGRRDSIVLSMLKEEWLNGGKEYLLQKIR